MQKREIVCKRQKLIMQEKVRKRSRGEGERVCAGKVPRERQTERIET